MQSSINWPKGYTPGFTDNFCSNEVIVAGMNIDEVWKYLNDTKYWPLYYSNVADIHFYDDYQDSKLYPAARFFFRTFGFPIEAEITEYVAPSNGQPGRISWHGWDGELGTDQRLDVIHAWLIEELDGGRIRILTQESQIGEPAKVLAKTVPNPMINGHQAWLDGIVHSVRTKLEI
ncbi:SRPBCC domain-containing protein [Gallibacterium sp. AGMB14963]|uniref:SRPBCC domain-containing protein n=1 Tax=Gallibacterium faecale TaxID=3019086 RepID=UPI0022F1928A|nr:SRPBCC domain-containing protein [Gallibacterium sp. AGMB14963]MDA3977506.1 SRPBCC domain-containing protein [Gallibacterium sp. AGMB14963]